MTTSEALEKSATVIAKLWPEWWQPAADHGDDFWPLTAKPPPNLLEPQNFIRALKSAQHLVPLLDCDIFSNPGEQSHFVWSCKFIWRDWLRADTPEEALLLALFDLVTREKR